MKVSRALFAVICLATAISLYGQGEFKPGYIIDLNQDTIYGEIKSGSESRNAQICVFRSGTDAEASEFRPGEIKAYRFTGGSYYVSMEVEEDGVKKQMFVEYLVNGMADLYYLRDNKSETYYIRKEGEDALAIADIRLLKAVFSDCMEIQSSLDKATLTHNSLISMTEKYHDYVCDGEACIIYSKEASRIRIHVGPVVGYTMNFFRIRGNPTFDIIDFEPCTAPVFGILLDLGFSRLGDHLSFQLGTGYSKQNFEGYGEVMSFTGNMYTYDAHLDGSFLSFRLGTRYSFSGKRVRPSLGGGFECSKFINPDCYYVRDLYIDGEYYSSLTWSQNPVKNPLFGGYLQAGLDVILSKNLVLVSAVSAGILTSNPVTLVGMPGFQDRFRPDMIPVSIQIGIQF